MKQFNENEIYSPSEWRKIRIKLSALMFLALTFGLFYIFWRSFYTLNFNNGYFSTIWSFVLLSAEAYSLLIFVSFSLAVAKNANTIISSPKELYKPFYYLDEWPTVDVFVTSYNESIDIVKDTLIACMKMDYPNKRVYLLDDGRRAKMLELTKELGCNYITRNNNKGYKAGNLNNALKQTDGEIIVIFDADHVPVSTFLKETVGFFENEKLALLQTPQYFLNLDPFQKNLNLERHISNEQELFYKVIEPGLAEYDSTICGGTNFLARRKYVEEAGYFPENTITEDFALSLRLQSLGYKVSYYNKPLATGLSVETFSDYIKQRSRWAKGNIQAILDPTNYKNLFKLKPLQFFFNFMGAFYFLYSFPRMIFILSPILFILCGVMPVKAVVYQIAIFQSTYFAFKILFFQFTAGRYRHFLFTDVYESATSLFMSIDLLKMFLIPNFILKQKFIVTNKSNIKYQKEYLYYIPLFILASLVIITILKGFYFLFISKEFNPGSVWVNIFWSVYNLAAILFAIKVTTNKPEIRKHIRVPVKTKVKLYNEKGYVHILNTVNISKTGALLINKDPIQENFFVDSYLVFPGCGIKNLHSKQKTQTATESPGYKVELIATYKKGKQYYYRIKLDECPHKQCSIYENCKIENMFMNSNNWDW